MNADLNGGSRLLRIFGGGKPPAPAVASNGLVTNDSAQAMLIAEISDFLLGNGLAVTANNLLAAHAAFSGADPALARKVIDRRASGAAVTQEWLDQHRAPDDMREGVKKIVSQLESSLDSFALTTRSAREAAASYHTALEGVFAGAGDNSLDSLANLASAMIGQTAHFAAEMQRSADETHSLRRELEKARHDADFDHLTGLPNRRAFEALLDRHFREARQDAENLCVAFCDIDHFKRVNDTHGHDTGDRVLRAVADALARITNDNCHVARQGGEEFVMLFRDKTPQEAWEKLDAVRENFGNRRFVNRSNEDPIGHITFSGGIADVFAHSNPRDALKAADEALYRAKEEGRNRILISGG